SKTFAEAQQKSNVKETTVPQDDIPVEITLPALGPNDSPDTISLLDAPTSADSTDVLTVNSADSLISNAKAAGEVESSGSPSSLWGIFIAGLIGGFAAFLMPCIYPMVPLTTSFFTKQGGNRVKGLR